MVSAWWWSRGFAVGLGFGVGSSSRGSWVLDLGEVVGLGFAMGLGFAVGLGFVMGLPWVLGEHSEEEKRNEKREKKKLK